MQTWFISLHGLKNVALFLQKKGLVAGLNAQLKGTAKVCVWMDTAFSVSMLVAALIVCNACALGLELLCEGLKRVGSDGAFQKFLKSLRIFDGPQCLPDSFGARPVHDF